LKGRLDNDAFKRILALMADQSRLIDKSTNRFKRLARLSIGILLVLVLLWLLVVLNTRVAGYGGHWEVTDFMEFYLGGRALLEGVDPYNPVAWESLHQKYAEQYISNPVFIYPLPTAFLFVPFAIFSTSLGAESWMLVNEVLLIITIGLMIQQSKLKRNLPGLLALALIIGAYLPMLLVLGSGQYSIMMLILIMAVYLLLQAGVDWVAGVCLTVLLIRPNPVLLVFPVLLGWALISRRYKLIWGSLLSGLVFLIISLWISPQWISIWIRYTIGQSGKINSYGLTSQTLRAMVFELGSGLSSSAQLIVILGISLLTILIAALVVIRHRDYHLSTLMALAVTTSLCISPYAWNYDQMILLFPMFFIQMRSDNCPPKQMLRFWIGIILIFLLLPYVIRYVEMVQYKFTLSVLISFVVLLMQLWVIRTAPKATENLQPQEISADYPV
jgi:hypothetical protein